MSLNAVATSRCSARALDASRARRGRRRPPARAAPARPRSGRASEPASSQATPRPSSSATGAHADQREHVVALTSSLTASTLWVTRTAPTVRSVADHGHGREEQVLAERVAVALALVGLAAQRLARSPARLRTTPSPRPGPAESASSRPRGSTTITRPPSRAAELAASSARAAAGRSSRPTTRGREQLRLALRLALDLGVHAPRQVQRQRHPSATITSTSTYANAASSRARRLTSGPPELVRAREAEAHAADGVDEARVRRVVAELAAQARHVHVERLRGAEPVRVPDLVDQPLARDHRAGLAHQQLEQLELLAGEVELLAGERHAAAVGVEPQAAHLERSAARRRRPGAWRRSRRSTARMRATTSRALNGLTM